MVKKFDRNILLGLGFDAQGDHRRITKGENYYLFGGSKKTHGLMQEKAIKFNEELKRRDKTLDNITSQEFYEIGEKIGLKVPPKEN